MRVRRTTLLCAWLLLIAALAGVFVAVRARNQQRAKMVLEDLHIMEGAVDQWMIANGKTHWEVPRWKDCKPYIKLGSRILRNEGNDVLGHPYVLGSEDEGLVSIDPRTVASLAWVIDPEEFAVDTLGERRHPAPEMIQAARQGSVAWLKSLLKQGGDIDQTDSEGRSPLFWAAAMGDLEMARAICALHPRPVEAINREPAVGGTPMQAAAYRYPEIVALFMDCGAVTDPQSIYNSTRRVEVLSVLLCRGVSPDSTDMIGEPILLTAAHGNLASVRLLIENGATVDVRGKDSMTALQVALRNHQPEIAEVLRSAGAKD